MALALASDYEARAAALRNRSMDCLAPKFSAAVEAAIAECRQRSIDATVFETCRSEELAQLYYQHGASKAPTALYSWHAYGLAVDVISEEHGWDKFPGGRLYHVDPFWWVGVYSVFTGKGLDAGADWQGFRDFPHWQFGSLKASPSDRARELRAEGGNAAVWAEVAAV